MNVQEVRCNYTKENIHSYEYLINDFRDLLSKDNLRFSFHKVWQEKEDEELRRGVIDLKKQIKDVTFKSNINAHFGEKINPCYADYEQNYVINYNNDVFKCTARDFHPNNRIGQLLVNGDIAFNKNALQRVRNSRTADCPTCRMLPICFICSQRRSESIDGKCPIKISSEEISKNIKDYFLDLYTSPNAI